jgi:hypothetical protein
MSAWLAGDGGDGTVAEAACGALAPDAGPFVAGASSPLRLGRLGLSGAAACAGLEALNNATTNTENSNSATAPA